MGRRNSLLGTGRVMSQIKMQVLAALRDLRQGGIDRCCKRLVNGALLIRQFWQGHLRMIVGSIPSCKGTLRWPRPKSIDRIAHEQVSRVKNWQRKDRQERTYGCYRWGKQSATTVVSPSVGRTRCWCRTASAGFSALHLEIDDRLVQRIKVAVDSPASLPFINQE